jgi:hypothetical protein
MIVPLDIIEASYMELEKEVFFVIDGFAIYQPFEEE